MTMPFDDEPFSPWSIHYWIAASIFFWKDWWSSRPRGAWFLIGLVASLAFLYIVLSIVPRALRESTRQSYEKRWVAAEKKENWIEADLWLQRVIAMGDRRPTVRYHYAMVSEKLGRQAQTLAIMRGIAADDAFPPAHAWLAAQSLDEDATPDEIKQAIVHLEEAVKLNKEDERLHLALADAYKRSGKIKEAANQVWAVAAKNHSYDLPLARLYAELGNMDGVRKHAALAEKHLTDKASREPENVELVESIADTLILQGKWQDALSYVERRIVNEERSKIIQSRIHSVASQELMKNPATQLEAVKHLYLALEASPKNRIALLRLARLAPQIVQINPREVEPIRKWLTLAHETEPDNQELTALLGMLHMQAGGDLEKAEDLLAKASEKEPILLLDVAQIQEQLKKTEARDQTLRTAVKQLSSNPMPGETQFFAVGSPGTELEFAL